MIVFDKPAQFFTATNLQWIHVLKHDTCKHFIIDALKHRVNKNQATIYGYVIMPNHIHLIWQVHDNIDRADFQREFLKFTAKHVLNWCSVNDKDVYEQLQVDAADRRYQVWERNSLSTDLYSEGILIEKLNYIHNNPLQPHWKLVSEPGDYKYSSCRFYETGQDPTGLLRHYKG